MDQKVDHSGTVSYDNRAMVNDEEPPGNENNISLHVATTSSTVTYDVNRNVRDNSADQSRTGATDVTYAYVNSSGTVTHCADVRKRDVTPKGGAVQFLGMRPLSDASSVASQRQEAYPPDSLEMFVSRKQGNDIKQHERKKLRSFYKKQDELIVAFEDLSKEDEDEPDTDQSKRRRRLASIFAKITLGINTSLLIAKLVASLLSGSMSIISSLVDSVVDLMSGIILWWASRAIKRRDPYAYPQGRTKLEPVSIIILSVVMGMASLQLIREAAQIIGSLAGGSTDLPNMTIATFVIAGSTVVIKFILWMVSRRVDSPIVQALALDHRNDVMSNSVAIVCGYLGSSEFQDQVGIRAFVYADPVGAILIGMYIIYNWWQTGKEQLKTLTGHTADPDFISKVTWVAMNHDPRITHIDTVRAYHYGNNFIVKVDIVLPEAMELKDAHDIGESLQQKIEKMEGVERAFVHVDYEYSHHPATEHKPV